MKDSLLNMLMNFFEQSLTQLVNNEADKENSEEQSSIQNKSNSLFINNASNLSTRIFTEYEKNKLSKASYQFLMKMYLSRVINSYQLETILHEALLSESRFVSLQEIKWIMRNNLMVDLNEFETAFLDLVLYQQEDKILRH